MMSALRAEFRKLLTVRSVYIICLLFLLLGAFVTFYVHGYKDSSLAAYTGNSPVDHARLSRFVAGTVLQIGNVLSVASALVALLLMTHEYRYNTIVYSLTAVNRRSKVLGAKILAVLGFVFVYSVVGTTVLLGLVWAGAAAAGHPLPHQSIDLLTFYAKTVFFCEAFAMTGLLFATLLRNQVGAIAALFILPNTLEGLLSLLLKQNTVYLPFSALQQVIQPPVIAKLEHAAPAATGSLSPSKGALVFLCYLVVGWIVAWYLFLKRDAN